MDADGILNVSAIDKITGNS